MMRWRKLMVLYNRRPGDDAGLERAIALARSHDAELIIAETVPEGSAAQAELLDAKRLHLRRFASALQHDGISAAATVLHGDAVTQIVREVHDKGIDLVLVAGGRDAGWWPFAANDPARMLLRECPCPVWITSASSSKMRRILAAVSLGTTRQEYAHDLDILNTAAALARREGGALDILHAWQFAGDELDTSRSGIGPDVMRSLERRNIEKHELAMRRLLRDAALGDIPVSWSLPRGKAEEEIPKFVRDSAANLVVIGVGPRHALASLWQGSLAEAVLAARDSEVLTVKPDTFVSGVDDDLPCRQSPSAA